MCVLVSLGHLSDWFRVLASSPSIGDDLYAASAFLVTTGSVRVAPPSPIIDIIIMYVYICRFSSSLVLPRASQGEPSVRSCQSPSELLPEHGGVPQLLTQLVITSPVHCTHLFLTEQFFNFSFICCKSE